MFFLYLVEKTFNIYDRISQNDSTLVVKPEIAFELRFPYERNGDSVRQELENPVLGITNRGNGTIAPLRVSVTMFVLDSDLITVESAAYFRHRVHDRLIFEPELKPGVSVSELLPGIRDWLQPAVYRIEIEEFSMGGRVFPQLSMLGLIDNGQIKLQHSGLLPTTISKLQTAIATFEKNKDLKRRLDLDAVAEGVWLVKPSPEGNLIQNEDGTITLK